jgi:hypothetical protein
MYTQIFSVPLFFIVLFSVLFFCLLACSFSVSHPNVPRSIIRDDSRPIWVCSRVAEILIGWLRRLCVYMCIHVHVLMIYECTPLWAFSTCLSRKKRRGKACNVEAPQEKYNFEWEKKIYLWLFFNVLTNNISHIILFIARTYVYKETLFRQQMKSSDIGPYLGRAINRV